MTASLHLATKGHMSIDLGLPTLPPPTLAPRRRSRQISVGKVAVGGDAPISVQSMTTTLTADINATLQQIAELTATGCDIVRVAVPSQDEGRHANVGQYVTDVDRGVDPVQFGRR